MKNTPVRALLCALVLFVVSVHPSFAVPPPAPAPLTPADAAGVLVPFTISWSAVTDPGGIVAYNWQVASSSSFASVVLQGSTNGQTQDTVSGLPNGTYFWRAQALNSAFELGAWSATRSFNVTGTGANSPGTPTLGPTQAYSTFHPFETMTFNWTSVPGAATYVLEAATDPSFPITTRIHLNNIPGTTMTFAVTDRGEGSYWARVYAVDANGIAGVPSNLITFSVFFNNPIGPPPALVSPANGTTLVLPVTLTWAHVPNPQPSGYELQIAQDSRFSTIEEDAPQLNGPSRQALSLTAGTKFWRVRSGQGDASPTTAAFTAWSSTGTFTIPSAPPTPVSVTLARNPLFSGQTTLVQLQLTSAVAAAGATIALSSSNAAAFPVPATIAMPGNAAWTQFDMNQFGMKAGQVTAPTPVTITATLSSASASGQFTVLPPSLNSLSISPSSISGGAQPGGIVLLNGQAPAGGALVMLSSNSAAVSPPPTVTVLPGVESVSFPINTSAVTTNTTVTVTATWNGTSVQSLVTLTPQQPPASITLSPTSTIGLGGSSFATVTVASPNSADETLQVTSSNPAVASVPNSVTIPVGSTTGGFNIFTTSVNVQTLVTISVSGGGVTRSAVLTVNPQAPAAAAGLTSIAVTPSSVTGGSSSQGTVTLSSGAPQGGAVVALSVSNPGIASVPASVTIPAGATSATFSVTTTSVSASTATTLSAAYGGVTRTATLTVNPPLQPATLTVTASGRSGESITSSPAGVNVLVGSSASSTFTTGTAITLGVSNGRSAIWSGACSSNGNKVATCTFTLSAAATVSANVQ